MTKTRDEIIDSILYHPPTVTTAKGSQCCVYCLIDVYDRGDYLTDEEHKGNCPIGWAIKLKSEPDEITPEALEGLGFFEFTRKDGQRYFAKQIVDRLNLYISWNDRNDLLVWTSRGKERTNYVPKTLSQLRTLLELLGVGNE